MACAISNMLLCLREQGRIWGACLTLAFDVPVSDKKIGHSKFTGN